MRLQPADCRRGFQCDRPEHEPEEGVEFDPLLSKDRRLHAAKEQMADP